VLASLIGSRADILTLLTSAPESVRKELIAKNQHVRHEVDRVFTMIADHLRKDAYVRLTNDARPMAFPPQVDVGQLTEETAPGFVEEEQDGSSLSSVGNVFEARPGEKNREEQRRGTRHKSFLRGCIYFNNRRASVECHIRDISQHGARILISAAVNIPDVIELYIPQSELTQRARVEWREREEIGVAFIDATPTPSLVPQPNEFAHRIGQLETEITSLRAALKA